MVQKSAALLAAEAALEAAKAAHLRDLNAVFSALHYEAEYRGWCDEYQVFVEGVLSGLSMKPTEGVETEREIDVLGLTVKVNATSDRHAVEKLHDFLNNSTYRGVLETD